MAGAGAALLPQALVLLAGSGFGAFSPASPGYALFAQGSVPHAPPGWLLWLFFCIQSSFEECLFRGILFALLASLLVWLAGLVLAPDPLAQPAGPNDAWRRKAWFHAGLAANCIVSLGFASIHAHNPNVTPFALGNIGLAGFALGQLYWLQGNLWGCCAMHTVWNAALATFGLPVSGILLREPLVGHIRGAVPGLLTGGSFGPEGSAVTTVGFAALSGLLVWLSWRRAASPAGGLYAGAADR
jgi:membrane protease YdiL (CAAX protease family)